MSGPVDKATLMRLAETRLAEARSLLNGQHWSGAYYLAGYAVELSLKACVATQFHEAQIPSKKLVQSIFSHELSELLALAQLKEVQEAAANENPEFQKNWNFAKNWKETARYEIIEESDAKAMVDAIGHPADGVFRWICRHW